MLQDYNRYKILQVFFDSPRKKFYMREISRITQIAQPSVINHLNSLIMRGFVIKEKDGLYPTFSSNRDIEIFKVYKKFNLISRIHETCLLGLIYEKCTPDVLILFGSASRGEDTEESDIDLFVQAPEKKLELKLYEKLLKRKINLFFEENFPRLSEELKNNILNGIILKGYINVF